VLPDFGAPALAAPAVDGEVDGRGPPGICVRRPAALSTKAPARSPGVADDVLGRLTGATTCRRGRRSPPLARARGWRRSRRAGGPARGSFSRRDRIVAKRGSSSQSGRSTAPQQVGPVALALQARSQNQRPSPAAVSSAHGFGCGACHGCGGMRGGGLRSCPSRDERRRRGGEVVTIWPVAVLLAREGAPRPHRRRASSRRHGRPGARCRAGSPPGASALRDAGTRPEGADVVGGPVTLRAALAVAGDARVERRGGGRAAARRPGQRLEDLRPHVGHENVGAVDELVRDCRGLSSVRRLTRCSACRGCRARGRVGRHLWPAAGDRGRERIPVGRLDLHTSAPQSASTPLAEGRRPRTELDHRTPDIVGLSSPRRGGPRPPPPAWARRGTAPRAPPRHQDVVLDADARRRDRAPARPPRRPGLEAGLDRQHHTGSRARGVPSSA